MVICSDGLDRGDPAVLARRWSGCPGCATGSSGSTRTPAPAPRSSLGMMVAAPHVDVLLPATTWPTSRSSPAPCPGLRMIRLGSLAGYPFEGPRVLAGWTPPAMPAVYAVLYRPEPETADQYAVIYVGHTDDLSTERFPFRHPAAPCWIQRAGQQVSVYICTYEVPGGLRRHREQIVEELVRDLPAECNEQQYDRRWKDDWIGEYDAPTTGPLTTGRRPGLPPTVREQPSRPLPTPRLGGRSPAARQSTGW